MLTTVQFKVLKKLWPHPPDLPSRDFYRGKAKIEVLLGPEFMSSVRRKKVIDFGCGDGSDAIAMARAGAEKVIGIEIRPQLINLARERARAAGVGDICVFTQSTDEAADLVVSIDAFEHFEDPAAVLASMQKLMKRSGHMFISFGPVWYHPRGGHLFSVFPWSHIVFEEKAFMKWRSTFKSDGATRFGEVEGGLNRMTIKRFERLVQGSSLRLERLELVPVRKLRWIHTGFTREFTTAIVRCRLSVPEPVLRPAELIAREPVDYAEPLSPW